MFWRFAYHVERAAALYDFTILTNSFYGTSYLHPSPLYLYVYNSTM